MWEAQLLYVIPQQLSCVCICNLLSHNAKLNKKPAYLLKSIYLFAL